VSPFNDTRGSYAVDVRLSPQKVAVSVGLDRDGERVMTATAVDAPEPATLRSVLRVAARHALMTRRVWLLILA